MTVSRLIHVCRQRLRSLFRKEQLDEQLDQELLFHLEQLEQENIEAGMSAEEARGAARLALGNTAVLSEECRDQRGVSWLHDFRQDVHYGLRTMRKRAGFTALAAISLAVAIGGNTAILSVGSTLLLGELPLPDADRLVVIRMVPNKNPQGNGLVAVPDYVAWQNGARAFTSMGANFANGQDLGGDQNGSFPERIAGQAVTPSLFETLNVQPLLGRVFRESEVQAGVPAPVIVLSHRLWQRRFGGDPAILGKQILTNGRNRTVIGVMPDGFWYPRETDEYWIPLPFSAVQMEGSDRIVAVTARLNEETTAEQAQAELRTIAAELARTHPDRYEGLSAMVVPLREQWYGWVRQPLLTLQAAVALILLIACANVSTLLLGRVPARRPEIAMRLLMGAGRGRIARQFLTESLLLSIIGGLLGLFVAWWAVRSLQGLDPSPGGASIVAAGQGNAILGFAALLSLISTLLFGFLPAMAALSSTNDVQQASLHGRRRSWSGILVPAQIGLALILLISCGLLLNSFVRLVLDDRGFDPRGVLTFSYRIPVQDYVRPLGTYQGMPAMDAAPPTLAIQRVYDKLRALPGAESVAGASSHPVNGLLQQHVTLHIAGRPLPSNPSERTAATVPYFLVTDSFFSTLKTPILRGRDFEAGDTASAPWVAVINETLARRFWPDEDPIGKRFTADAISGEREREVIGVVRDVALTYIRTGPPPPVAYTLYVQQPERYQGLNTGRFGQMTFFVRSNGDPLSLVSAARQAVAEVDPDRPLANIETMEAFVGDGMRARRFSVSAIGALALIATLLAAIGVYGVMAYSVAQRTREIGIRIAVGAKAYDILSLVGRRALRMIATGVAFGLLGSLALTRLIETQLWGIRSTDPLTFIGVTALLVFISLAACLHPARRAMRVSPTEALRTD
jgi:putative ABC transport system permease protein